MQWTQPCDPALLPSRTHSTTPPVPNAPAVPTAAQSPTGSPEPVGPADAGPAGAAAKAAPQFASSLWQPKLSQGPVPQA